MPLTKQMAKNNSKNIHFLRILRFFFITAGIFFTAAVIVAFTTLPFWGIHWLGTSKGEIKGNPASIVLLGGGGMPSESNLIRIWFTVKAARSFPEAGILIAMPGDPADSLSTPRLIKKELVIHGLDAQRIQYENKGTNTRSQALYSSELLKPAGPVLLVTSPDHARRAVMCFKKTGFKTVYALPAFENATEADLTYEDNELGGRKTIAPDVGENIPVRYQLWNHLKYEIQFIREMMAIGYYKVRGWI